MSNKRILRDEILPALLQKSPYVNIQAIRAAVEKRNLAIAGNSLKQYLSQFQRDGHIHSAGRGWYSNITEPFTLNHEPVNELVALLEKEFPLLDFCCWSTQQINAFTHHMLAKHVTFVYTDVDAIETVSLALREAGYNSYANPLKDDIAKHFRLEGKIVVVRREITKQPDDGTHYAPIEKILVDLQFEDERLQLMDANEVVEVVDNAMHSGRIPLGELKLYAERREFGAKTIY